MSSYIKIGQFVEIYYMRNRGSRAYVYNYQNAYVDRSIQYASAVDNPKLHGFLGFVYQGAARNRTGDNLQSSLIIGANALSTGLAKNLLDKRHYAVISTVQFDNNDNVARQLSQESWVVASMTYDIENVELILSSAIDAVGAQAPNKTLTKDRVGDLPITANIFLK